MAKNDIQSAMKKAMQNVMRPPKKHKNVRIKSLIGNYSKEAWKAKPNYDLMKDITKKIQGLRKGGKGKW